jgi:cephalosporin hydroxylase
VLGKVASLGANEVSVTVLLGSSVQRPPDARCRGRLPRLVATGPRNAGGGLGLRALMPGGDLPRAVRSEITTDPLLEYWRARVAQHTTDSYAGVGLSKFPEDLRTYEHLLWLQRTDTVIEIGTQAGGSALWFRDRLRTLASYKRITQGPRVISIDLDQTRAREKLQRADPGYASQIVLVEGDVRANRDGSRSNRDERGQLLHCRRFGAHVLDDVRVA